MGHSFSKYDGLNPANFNVRNIPAKVSGVIQVFKIKHMHIFYVVFWKGVSITEPSSSCPVFIADIVWKLRVIFVIKDKKMEDDSVSSSLRGEESKGNWISLFREIHAKGKEFTLVWNSEMQSC